MHVLFMASHRPRRCPGQRFRYEQYLAYLRQSGITCDTSFILSAEEDRLFYDRGRKVEKARMVLRAMDQRRVESAAAYLARYDVVFVHREALFLGPPWVERRIAKSRAKLVFDFDDAIWMPAVSASNRWASWIKFAHKVPEICALADVVTVGNAYLGQYAKRAGARRVEVLPTTIDTDYHVPKPNGAAGEDRPVCIGWTGSFSTVRYFELALGALRRVRERFGARVRFKLLGDASYRDDALGIRGQGWRLESEIEDLQDIDIGIMPLGDDEWTRGKCACKALQYMALEIPPVVSPVGANVEAVTDGVDGLYADSEDAWVQQLCRLVEDASLRRRLGAAGRQTVEARYSVRSQRDRYRDILRSLSS